MKRLVEFPLKEGGSIFVQIDEPETEGTVRAARGDTVEKAQGTFEDALSKVLPAVTSVIEHLRSIKPHEIEVTFGINLSLKAGCPIAFIVAGSAETNFGVKVNWTGKTEGAPAIPLEGTNELRAKTNE